MLHIQPLSLADYDYLAKLLADNELMTDDLAGENKYFYAFCDEQGWRVGVGGLESYGPDILLRSFLTVSAHRGQGLGAEMLALLMGEAKKLGAEKIYLFTQDAVGFFAKHGFTPVEKTAAPPAIRTSHQFRIHHSDSAKMMQFRLAGSV